MIFLHTLFPDPLEDDDDLLEEMLDDMESEFEDEDEEEDLDDMEGDEDEEDVDYDLHDDIDEL